MIIKKEPKFSLEELICRISCAEADELEPIVNALRQRYSQVLPEWEVVMLCMPTGNPDRQREQGKLLIEFIQKHYLNM